MEAVAAELIRRADSAKQIADPSEISTNIGILVSKSTIQSLPCLLRC